MTGTPPDALLLMGKQCPYCPTVLQGLEALMADGTIGALETVVIEDHPERAAALGVRSVPWVRIGSYELGGLRTEQELRSWAEKADTENGLASYLDELLSTGAIDKGLQLVRDNHNGMRALLSLLADTDTQLNTRIGISAIMEELQGSTHLHNAIAQLGTLTHNDDAAIRGDACFFLSLADDQSAIEFIEPLLQDEDASVRDIAQESLGALSG